MKSGGHLAFQPTTLSRENASILRTLIRLSRTMGPCGAPVIAVRGFI
jgi:hypothetical protein